MNVLGSHGDGGNIYNEHYNVVAGWHLLFLVGLMIISSVYGDTRTKPPRPADFKIRHDHCLSLFFIIQHNTSGAA
jgi:hypothetical protein